MSVTQIVTQFVTQPDMQYTILRGSTYWFSRRVPLPAGTALTIPGRPTPRRIGKNGLVRFSIGTGNARKAARAAAVAIDDLLATHRAPPANVQTPPNNASASLGDIMAGADRLRTALAEALLDSQKAELDAELSGISQEIDENEAAAIAAASVSLPLNDSTALLRVLAESGLLALYTQQATGKLPAGQVTADHIPAASMVMKASKQATDAFRSGSPIPAPATTASWDSLLDYYLEHHPLAPSSVMKYRLAVKRLASFANCPPAQLTRNQVIQWRDQQLAKQASKSVQCNLVNVGAVYRWALINDKLGEKVDPFAMVTVARINESTRDEFSVPDLQRILNRIASLDMIPRAAGGNPAAYWFVLLAALTGMRRGELWGLRLTEIEQEDGIHYLRLQDNSHRKLKNRPSARLIPLPAVLLKHGFLEYVGQMRAVGADRLFQSIIKEDKLTEWFGSVVRECITVPPGKMLDVHSLRHSFKTACRMAKLQKDVHDRLTGHVSNASAGANAGDDYGHVPLVLLKPAIDSVFPTLSIITPRTLDLDAAQLLVKQAEVRQMAGIKRAATMAAAKAAPKISAARKRAAKHG